MEAHKYEISEHNSTLIQRTDPIFEKTTYGQSNEEKRANEEPTERCDKNTVRSSKIHSHWTCCYKLSGDSLAANIVPGQACNRHHGGFFVSTDKDTIDW